MLYEVGYGLSPPQGSILEPGRLWTTVGRPWSGNCSARDITRELTIVDIATIFGLAHLIPETERRWLIKSRIDLRTFNEIY